MKTLQIISRIFFPERCTVCKRLLKVNEDFCSCCGIEEQKLSENTCENCGAEKESCNCKSKTAAILPHIEGVFLYSGLIQNKLLSFKFGGRKELYGYFGDLMSERVAVKYATADFDVVTFVPSSKNTVLERGYNQCELLSKRIADKLFIPCQTLLIKDKETKKQHTLTAAERLTNIKGSISLKENTDIKGKTVLLCDDIKTTGATLKECTDVLISAGAKDVYCIVTAITSNIVSFSALDKEDKKN